ncbi:MAG: NUDIX hydrolase [Fulvimarina manganoxydans]|uniref:NUDIX hydrolase n=1 Tax=Fulvimarina manganoxydans TaxID=937218 RepID=UPI0023524020|nr:NUDIX hydrolase [Fulvimarina manganoxydans]MCK5931252.1 NUDIX hydrolase [Fulvimarina manganoxydans]
MSAGPLWQKLLDEAAELEALGHPPVAIRPAASLVILDESESPAVLMGRRGRHHRFMPGVFVFPGGGVEPCDRELAKHHRLNQPALDRLHTESSIDTVEASALALAAIRETFEETGLLLGAQEHGDAEADLGWPYNAPAGFHPRPQWLTPLARAVTPPGGSHRYDTRFFVTCRSNLVEPDAPQFDPPTLELEDIGWVRLSETGDMPLAAITRAILQDVQSRFVAGTLYDPNHPIPFYRRQGQAFLRDLI